MKSTLILGLVAYCTVCMAQADRTMTLEECLAASRANNLTLKNARLAVQQAKDMQGTSFTLEPTEFTLGQDLTGGGNPDNSLAVGQTFELPMVYSARRKALKKQTEVERNREMLTQSTVDKEVTAAYYNIMYTRERFNILMKQDTLIHRFHKMAEQKEEDKGVGSLDHINANRMLADSHLKTQAAHNNYRMAQLRMAQLINQNVMVVPVAEKWDVVGNVVASPTPGSTRVASPTPVFAPAETTAMMLAGSELAASESELKNVRNEGLPTVSLEGKYQVLIKGLNPYDVDRPRFEDGNFLAFAVGVNIPLCFGAQAAKVRAAKRGIEIERNNMELLKKELQTAYCDKYNQWTNAKLTVDYFKECGLKQAADMERMSIESYGNGEINYVELMENLQTATEMRLQYTDAVGEYNLLAIELEYMGK